MKCPKCETIVDEQPHPLEHLLEASIKVQQELGISLNFLASTMRMKGVLHLMEEKEWPFLVAVERYLAMGDEFNEIINQHLNKPRQ